MCAKQQYENDQSLTAFFCIQIITVKDPKRRLSLSSEDSEAEEHEYHKDVDNDLPVLDDHSQLLDDHHIKRVRKKKIRVNDLAKTTASNKSFALINCDSHFYTFHYDNI